jgi:argininosuccinate synthase
MLKWIQDEYEAEVVALTINLGQPGEDYASSRSKALQLRARWTAMSSTRARSSPASTSRPAILANAATTATATPLFTALRPPN